MLLLHDDYSVQLQSYGERVRCDQLYCCRDVWFSISSEKYDYRYGTRLSLIQYG